MAVAQFSTEHYRALVLNGHIECEFAMCQKYSHGIDWCVKGCIVRKSKMLMELFVTKCVQGLHVEG